MSELLFRLFASLHFPMIYGSGGPWACCDALFFAECDLLASAVTCPGLIFAHYDAFWHMCDEMSLCLVLS